jgi:glycerol-3-phosphate acyltransferase PlsX
MATKPLMKIAIDAMGGDFGPSVTVPAALSVLKKHKNVQLIMVGNEATLKPLILDNPQITIRHASQQVTMDESPSKALRSKKDSSMRVAIDLVKSGEAAACVSAGNTGALMAIARLVLRTIPGIDRPAIITALPTFIENKDVWVLDLGANVDSTPEHLYQFAVMGSVLAAAVGKISSPALGLLNVGAEEIKGNETVKQAAILIQQHKNLNYYGYVEGDDIFKGIIDVVVCDGFTGNVALKAMEGIAKLVGHYIKKGFKKNLYTKLVAIAGLPILKGLKKQLDSRNRNGASLIGLQGIVIKSHGGAEQYAFANAIEEAILEVENNVTSLISEKISTILQEG